MTMPVDDVPSCGLNPCALIFPVGLNQQKAYYYKTHSFTVTEMLHNDLTELLVRNSK
jgi:hypothetical protein